VTANCGVTNLRITYWGGWKGDGRINISTDRAESYTCAEKQSAFAVPVYIVRLCCLTATHRVNLPLPGTLFRLTLDTRR
jgi:hypothetical protein